MTPTIDAPDPVVDGRRARRERGRLGVIDAVLDLTFEGHHPPSAEQIAERAGVSVASVFRYFESLDEMRAQAIEHYFDRFAHLFDVPDIAVGTLDQRIRSLVAARVRQHETTSPVARMVRARVSEVADLDTGLHHLRAAQADQVGRHFDDELVALTPANRNDVVATVATLTSFESWDQFRHDHDRSPAQTRRAWTRALHHILDDLRPPEGAPPHAR
jgi:AcrR family transcriptional regulator